MSTHSATKLDELAWYARHLRLTSKAPPPEICYRSDVHRRASVNSLHSQVSQHFMSEIDNSLAQPMHPHVQEIPVTAPRGRIGPSSAHGTAPQHGLIRRSRAPSAAPTGVPAGVSPAARDRYHAAPRTLVAVPPVVSVPPVKDAGHTRPAAPLAVRPVRRAPLTPASATADAPPEAWTVPVDAHAAPAHGEDLLPSPVKTVTGPP